MSSLFSRLAAVAAISVAGALLVPATASATSQSPAVTVPLCQAVTVGGQQVTAITFPAGSAVANAYDAGQAIAIQGNNGTLVNVGQNPAIAKGILTAAGTFDSGSTGGIVPLCAAIKSGDGEASAPQSAWRFCTDKNLTACTNQAGAKIDSNPKLSSEKSNQILYLLGHLPQSTTHERAFLQAQVWCISDGALFTSATDYFNGQLGNNWPTDSEKATGCLKDIPTTAASAFSGTASIAVTGSSPVATGAHVTFTVTPTFPGHFEFSVTPGASIVQCADPTTAGATSADLNDTANLETTVCVTSSAAQSVTLTVKGRYLASAASATWYWPGQSSSCQVFADFSNATFNEATGEGSAVFQDKEVTPDTPSASDQCGTEHDSYTIPKTPGVGYYSGEELLEPGTHPTGGASTVTITASAQQGYTLPEGAKAEWTFTFGTSPCTSTSTSTSTNPTTDPPASTSATAESTATTALTVSGQSSSMAAGSAGDSTTSIAVKGESDQVTDLASTGVPQSMPWIALAGAALIGFGFALTRVRRSTRAH